MRTRFVTGVAALVLLVTFGLMGGVSSSAAAGAPSGERMFGTAMFDSATGHFAGGGGAIEPAYNATTGALLFIQTPNGPGAHIAKRFATATVLPKNVAPIYLPMYPVGSGIDPASLNCAHVPADNCPDHGPEVAGAAMGIEPSVYGAGVLGHDHLLGVASSGGDFNILWEPVLVLFTSVAASMTHITTLAQIQQAEAASPPQVMLVPDPAATFHCSIVSAASYNRATPAPSI